LTQERVYKTAVRDTSDVKQRLRKRITKHHRRSCWSTEKMVTCTRENESTSLWTSEPPPYTTGYFHSYLQSTADKHRVQCG